jgi:hypothetical protein
MSAVQVRPLRRADREQLTALVNAHIQAVVPGVTVSVNAVLSQLERDPGEFIVDPWVAERATLVAEQRCRVVAAAHLLRYGAGEDVGKSYRDRAEINWLLYWPEVSYWPDSTDAAGALMDACLDQLRSWRVDHWHADGALPAPGVYGVPEQWPHIRALYERAGFVHQPTGSDHDGHTEIVLLAMVDELPRSAEPPIPGLQLGRALGVNGTGCTGSSTTRSSATSRSTPTWPRADASPTWPAGPTSATSTSTRPSAAAGWPPGWSARPPPGYTWPGSTGCSTMPDPRRRPCSPCSAASASASSPAPPAAGPATLTRLPDQRTSSPQPPGPEPGSPVGERSPTGQEVRGGVHRVVRRPQGQAVSTGPGGA